MTDLSTALIEEAQEERERNPYQFAILMALQSKPVYAGTVPEAEIARRRKANKVARASRKRNRA